ncbi:MAG: phosphatase PAP2 family protein [Candidatus Eisenbacteria sp.]|nr:phosphatase PAP2 family protein [Candidatus Eisenbacteria bacterium]
MIELLHSIDRAILLWIHQGWRSGPTDLLFPWITELRHFIVPLAVGWLLLMIFGGRRGRITGLLLVASLILTDQIAGQWIKPWVERVRPCFAVEGVTALIHQVHSASFPSNHAANVFGASTVLRLRGGPRWLWAFVPATLIGLSRVYVGVHYPSDVVGGMVLGMACGALVCGVVSARSRGDRAQTVR